MATNYPNDLDNFTTLPVVVDHISPIRADDVNRVRNAVVSVETELGKNPSGVYSTVKDRLDAIETGNLVLSDYISGQIETPDEGIIYILAINIPFSGSITTLTTICSTGTCTATVKINGTAITGDSASVSTVEEIIEYSDGNSFLQGDELTFIITDNASCANLAFLINITRSSGPGGAGETGFASNVGTGGIGLFKQKVDDTFQFRNINAGSSKVSVSLDSTHNEADIDVVPAYITLDSLGGTLSVAKGGTGQITLQGAIDTFSPLTTKGDVHTHNGVHNARLGVGIDGYVLVADSMEPVGLKWTTVVGASGAPTNAPYLTISNNATLTQERVLVGTSGQILLTDGGANSSAALSLVSTAVSPGSYTNTNLTVDGYGRLTAASTGSSGAPNNASYLTLGLNSSLTSERILFPASGQLVLVDSGANNNATLGLATTAVVPGSYTSTNLTVDGYGRITSAATGSGAGANTSLSNLSSVAVNASLIPAIDDGYNLGSPTLRWHDGYFGPTSVHIHSLSSETTTSRDWKLNIAKAVGATQGRLGILENSSEYLSITPTGNVGIATIVPSAKLHVDGYIYSSTNGFKFPDGSIQATAATGSGGSGTVDGTGAANRVAYWLDTDTLTSSANFTWDGSALSVDGSAVFNEAGADKDFRIEGDTDPNLFFIDASTDRVGIGTNTPTSSKLHVSAGSIPTTTNALRTTGTLANPGSGSEIGNRLEITSSGSGSAIQYGTYAILNSGFTGGVFSAGMRVDNNAAGTATSIVAADGNYGILGVGASTTTGTNVGIGGIASGGDQSIGVYGLVTATKDNATSIGVLGLGRNVGSSSIQIGGYFAVQSSNPTFVSAGLIADNSNTASPIFLCRDEGSIVLTVADGGVFTQDGSAVFNEAGADKDFRIEGDTQTNLFFVDASADKVGVGTNTPVNTLHVSRAQNTYTGLFIENTDTQLSAQSRIDIGNDFSTKYGTWIYNCAANSVEFGGASGATGGLLISATATGAGITFSTAAGVVERFAIKSTSEVVFNDPGNDYDFRVESDGYTHAIFVDASADAVGIKEDVPTSGLHLGTSIAYPTTLITTTTTLNASHHYIRADATGGSITVNLPAAATCVGRVYVIKKVDSSGNSIVLDPSGAELIDGASTQTIIVQYNSFTIISIGSGWEII